MRREPRGWIRSRSGRSRSTQGPAPTCSRSRRCRRRRATPRSSTYDKCPLQYAFSYVYRMPPREEPVAALTFGGTAHAAFEAFTTDRREREARGDPPPTREDLERAFRARWVPTDFGDKVAEEGYQRKVANLLDNFWQGEVSSLSEALFEEQGFELTLEPEDGSAP